MTVPVVVFPDAAAVGVSYLRDELQTRGDTAGVFRDVPNPRLVRFVTVRRGGGIRETAVSDAATLLVECWDDSSEDAHDLAQLCRALLIAAPGRNVDGVAVYKTVEQGGLVDLPDPQSAQARYTFSVQIHLRGDAA